MLKEKWNTGLRKGLIISLSVLLMSSFVFSFGTKTISAATYSGSSTHYNISVSQPNTSSGARSVIISWSPTSTANSRYIDKVTLSLGATTTQNITLFLYGTDNVEFEGTTDTPQINSVTTNSSTNVGSDIYFLNQYLSTINNHLVTMEANSTTVANYIDDIDANLDTIVFNIRQIIDNGIALRNYDIQLYNVAALSYFAGCGASVAPTNDFIDSMALSNEAIKFFDYPIMKGYENIDPTTSKSLFMYPGKEYIFIVVWNRTSALFNSNNYTFDVMSGYETPVMRRSYQNTLASTTIVNAMVINPTENQSRFTIDWSSTFVNYLNSYQYIPLYFGPLDQCPDEYLQLLNAGFSAEEQAGTTSEDLDDVNTEFNSQVSEIDDIQNDLEDDFQTNIQAIDTDLDFEDSFGQKFVTSAQWVRTQFETLTTQTPYGSILFFALTLGLALMIIGRVI